MGSLTACLKRVESVIDPDHADMIKEISADYRADGFKAQEAALKAIDDVIEMAISERADVVDQIEAKGGSVEPIQAQVKETASTSTKPEGKEKEAAEATQGPIEAYGDETLDLRRMQDKTPSLQKDLSEDDIASMPLSKIWPKKEVDAIEDDGVAAFATASRSEIPNKPRKGYKLKRWVEKVKTLRGLTSRYMEDPEGVRKRMMESPALRDFAQKVDLLTQVGREHWSRVEGVAAYPDAYRYGENNEQIPVPHVSVIIDGKRQRIDGVKSVNEGIDQIRQLLQDTTPDKSVNMKFTVRGREGSYFIHKEGDPEYRKLATFTSSAEALRYRREHPDKLADEWAKVKARDNVKKADVRNKDNRPRTGADYRQGKDVTVEQFHEEFGLRHVDWGKWVKDDGSRQTALNEAFDAFADLADIVGIPRKAIGLNGDLIITFGKRGHGWASAHFEADDQIINMTKTRGAGTLGHEWFHALDNYFQRQRGEPKGPNREDHFVTYRPERLFVHKDYPHHPGWTKAKLEERRKSNPNSGYFSEENWIPDPNHPEGVRPEVEARFAELVKVLDESPMTGRASKINKGKSDGYWSRILERAARSFENYVIAKMQKDGYHNDYLANVTSIDEFARDPGRYPYLLESEMEPVEAAFDNLFGEIQTRETDKGMAMFSRTKPLKKESAANAWIEIAKNDAVFSYPRSESKDFAAIMADVAPDKIIEEQDVRSADITRAWKVWPKSRNGFGYVIEYPDGNVQVSLKHYQPGESGSEIYAAAGNYAHNNGLKFSADIHGVGRTGNVRRIENLISLALKFRTTDFIQPFGKKADQWVEGDTAHNLQLMMEESYANAIEQYPDIKGYRFDPETNRITPRPVEGQEMEGPAGRGTARDTGNGKRNGPGLGRTKRRAIITGYLLGRSGESGAGSVLLENSQIGDIAGSLYSRDRGEGAAGAKLNPEYAIFGMPVDEIEATIGPIIRAWTNAPDVVVAETMDDPRIPEAVRADNQRQMSQGATGDVEGFIHNGTVYLVAENLRSPKDTVRVLLHEAVGHAGLQVFGKRLDRILDQIAKARPDEVAAKAEEYGLDMNTLKDRRMAAEEVLAEMAQTRPEISFVRQTVAAIRAWLRQHVPGFKDMKLTDDEIIQQFLIPARDFIESGRKTKGDSTKAFGVPDVAYSKDDKAWLRDAAMLWSDAAMDEDLFQNKASDKKTMQDIAEDAEFGLIVEDYKSGEYPNAVKEWIIRMPTEGGTLPVFVRENKDGTIEMNASRLQEGKSRGSLAYHIVANYAHNNGKVFKGDTEGLSDVAKVRRTENMLSSALKFRTTRHLRPHVKQNMAWEEGNDFANFVSLVERHYANIIDAVPSIKDVVYDPAEEGFISKTTGEPFSDADFERAATVAGEKGAEGIGPTTLKRAAFTNTLSQGESREVRRRLLGYVAQQLHRGVGLPTSLKGIQYSRTQDTDNTSSSGERNREISPIREGIRDRVDAFRFQMQDKLIDLKRKQQEIEGDPDSDPITDASNAYQKAAIWEGRAGERLNDFDEGQVQPLLEQVAETGLDWDTVGEWLVARHAEEANAYLYEINPDMEEAERSRLSGMSNEEADAILSEHADNASLQRVGEMVDQIGRRRVDELVADGLISQEMADAWRGRYEHYVPLKREEAESSDYLPARGQGFHLAGKASKQRTGSAYWTPSKILTNFLTQAQAGIVKGEKNRVGNALLNLVEQHPDQDFWAVDVDKTRREVRKLKSGNKVIEVPDNRIDDNELAVWRDGERHIIVFNRSNDRAMRLVSGLKNLQAGQMGKVMSAMSKVVRYLASINTSWNPEFIISNFFRDVQTAAYNLSDTDLSNMETRVLKDIPKAMNGIRSALFGDGSADWSRHWEDFRKHGGKTGWIDLHHDLNEVESDLKKQVERLKSGKATKSAWTRFFKRVDDLNMVVENGVRLSAYKNAVDAGISQDKAAALAKDLTVNFNRKGQLGPQINALYMFYNAGIQGSVRMLQAMVNSSKGRKLAVATIGFAITLDIVNRALSGEDDDGENLYDNINDHEKNHYLIIMGEKKPIAKIMLPWGYNVLHVIGQTIGEAMTSKRFDALKSGARLANAAVDAFNPVGSSTVIQTLSPTIIDPAVQIAENRAWHGGPLKPEHTFDSRAPRPEYQMHWASAGETYKEAAKWMNDMTGGNAVRPGWANVSPEILEMLFETATGGTGRTAMNTLDTVQKLIDGKPLEPKKTPFLRKVTGSKDEYGVKARYYEWSRDVAYAKSELGKLSGDDLEEAKARPSAKLIGFYSSTERRLRKLRKQRRLAVKSGQPEERIEAIDLKIREIMARFNRLYADKVLN